MTFRLAFDTTSCRPTEVRRSDNRSDEADMMGIPLWCYKVAGKRNIIAVQQIQHNVCIYIYKYRDTSVHIYIYIDTPYTSDCFRGPYNSSKSCAPPHPAFGRRRHTLKPVSQVWTCIPPPVRQVRLRLPGDITPAAKSEGIPLISTPRLRASCLEEALAY